MKKSHFFALSALVFLFLPASFASAVSVMGPTPAERRLFFEPGLTKSFSFAIGGAEVLQTYLYGELKDFMTLDDPNPGGGSRKITITLKLPDSLPIGTHESGVAIAEGTSKSGTITASTVIRAAVYVIVLRDEKYVEFNLMPHDSNVDEPTSVKFVVNSFTKQDVSSVQAFADIYQKGLDTSVASVKSNAVPLESAATINLFGNFTTDGFIPSEYYAKGWIVYDGIKSPEAESIFKVGNLNLDILSCSGKFYSGTINRFNINIKNGWNGVLEHVYAGVKVRDVEFSTPSIRLLNFQEKPLEGYLDATGLEPGDYDAEVVVYYADSLSKSKSCKITLEPKPAGLVEEKKQGATISGMTIVIVVISLLILFNALFFLFFSRKFRQQSAPHQQASEPEPKKQASSKEEKKPAKPGKKQKG